MNQPDKSGDNSVDAFLSNIQATSSEDDVIVRLSKDVRTGDWDSVAEFLARASAENVLSISAILRAGSWLTQQVAGYLADNPGGGVTIRNIGKEAVYKDGKIVEHRKARFTFKDRQVKRAINARNKNAVLMGDAHILVPHYVTVEYGEEIEVTPIKAIALLRRWSARAQIPEGNLADRRTLIQDALVEVSGEIEMVHSRSDSIVTLRW